jgi:hypothetical protein
VIAEADPLRRVERTALVVCVVMAGAALMVFRGRPQVAAGVVGGGLLAAVSYRAIKSGVTGLMTVVPAEGSGSKNRSNPSRILARLVLRYALLALLAYVMIARLRLHPVGLLAGASSVVAAVSIEAVRLLMKKS